MYKHQEHLTHARSLRASILAAPEIWLPRREILLAWLEGFMERAATVKYELESTEADDLNALEGFLRKQRVPVAVA